MDACTSQIESYLWYSMLKLDKVALITGIIEGYEIDIAKCIATEI